MVTFKVNQRRARKKGCIYKIRIQKEASFQFPQDMNQFQMQGIPEEQSQIMVMNVVYPDVHIHRFIIPEITDAKGRGVCLSFSLMMRFVYIYTVLVIFLRDAL